MSETRILVVENETLIAKDIENKLKRTGYTVAGAALTGADAVRLAGELRPDLILMDIKLSDEMDGVEAAKRIHANRDVPIIYLTAFADEDTVQCAKVIGPAGYIIKPFEERELQVNIEIALRTHALNQKLKTSEANLKSIFRAAPTGIGLVVDHVLMQANGRLCEITGYTPDELIGQNARMLYPTDEDYEYVGREKYTQIKKYGTGTVETRFQRKDGQIIDVLLRSTPLEPTDLSQGLTFTALDITERVQAEEALTQSKEYLDSIFNGMFESLVVMDLDYRIVDFNNRFLEQYGGNREELLGQTCYQLTHHSSVPCNEADCFCPFRGALQGDTLQLVEHIHKDPGGNNLYIEISCFPLYGADGKIEKIVEVRNDITERRNAELALAKRMDQLTLLNEVGNQIAASLDIDQLLMNAAQLIQERFGYHHVGIFTLGQEQEELVLRAKSGEFSKYFSDHHRLALGQGVVGWVGAHGQNLLINDVESAPQYVNLYPKTLPTRSELSVPIQMGTEILGVLDVQSPNIHDFDKNDVLVMETLADQIAAGLENARLYQAVQIELSERAVAQSAMQQERDRAQSYLDIAGVMLVVLNTAGEIIMLNRRGYQILGYAEGELLGKNWFTTCLPADVQENIKYVFAQLMQGRVAPVEYAENLVVTQDGDEHIIAWHNTVVTDHAGELIGTLASGEDITEQAATDQSLRESEARYRLLVENQTDLIIKTDMDGKLLFVSPSYCKTFGKTEAELLNQEFAPLVHEDDRGRVAQSLQKLMKPPYTTYYEERALTQDGWRWFGWSARATVDPNGPIKEFVSVGRDITERVHAVEALAKEAAINAKMADLSTQMLLTDTIDGDAELVLSAALELTNSPVGFVSLTDPLTNVLSLSAVKGIPQEQQQFSREVRSEKMRSGVVGWVLQNSESLLCNDPNNDARFGEKFDDHIKIESILITPAIYGDQILGNIAIANAENGYVQMDQILIENLASLYALGVRRKQAEDETLRHANELAILARVAAAMRTAQNRDDLLAVILEQTNKLFQASGTAVGVYDAQQNTILIEQSRGDWANWTGKSISASLGVSGQVIVTDQPYKNNDIQTDELFYYKDLLGEIQSAACVPLTVQGNPIGVLWLGCLHPITDEQMNLLISIGDMSAIALNRQSLYQNLQEQFVTLKRTQTRLIQSEKLAAIGELTAGVAHELNNPLTSILLYSEMLQQRSINTEIRADLQTIASEARRTANIVRGLLDFSRQRVPERNPIQINDVIMSSLKLVGYELKSQGINWNLELSPDIPITMADPHQLQQVFVNLFTNTRHAINSSDEKGLLSIYTKMARQTIAAQGQEYEEMILITIEDNGPGINPDILNRIFDPFFTTKPEGEGSGLGLSICHGIISEHGGNIWVDSELGKGTIFYIELPFIAPVETEWLFDQGPDAEQKTENASVLVIDDEPVVLEIVARIIERDGHLVDAVGNGFKALELLSKSTYDLILCDIYMPKLSGIKFYRLVEQQYPQMLNKIVFTTGDSVSRSTRDFLDDVGAQCLHKPFEKEELLSLVAEMISRVKT